MEDVLDVYHRSYDGNETMVCMDETSKQQVRETRTPNPSAPGAVASYDYEYGSEQSVHAVRAAGRLETGRGQGA